MSPYYHAVSSAKKWGGGWNDYIHIHDFLDSTKTHHVDNSHRMILHNSFGIEICERIFGHLVINSALKHVEVRYIVIKHIEEDLGFVPTIQDWCKELNKKDWMTGNNIKKVTVASASLLDLLEEKDKLKFT